MTRSTPRTLRRGLLAGGIGLLACAAPLTAEDAASEPEPFIQATVPSIAEAQEHFAASPYAKLAKTQWAQFGTTAATQQADQAKPGALQALKALERLSVAMEMNMMAPSLAAWLHADDVQPLLDLILEETGFTAVEGQDATWSAPDGTTLTQEAGRLKLAQGAVSLEEPELSAATGDLNLRINYSAMADMMGAMGQADQATIDMIKNMVIDLELTLAPIGVREKTVTHGMGNPEVWGMWTDTTAKLELLEGLPADTLWAATNSVPRETVAAWFETDQAKEMMASPGIAQFDTMLAGWGLPDYATILRAMGGDNLIYARTSAPFPALTIQFGIEEEVGRQLLTALAQRAGWMDAGDGTYQGLIGFSPIFGGYADGALVITSHPGGLAAHQDREPGFFTHELIQQALAELPAGKPLQVIGLSRSKDWYGALADLGAPFAAQSGIPGIALMGQDLRQAFSYGFLWSTMEEDGAMEMQSGGPLGGVMTGSMAVGGAGAAFFARRMMMGMQQQMEAPVELEEAQ